MSAKLAARYISTINSLQARREAGATGLEYAGMIVVAAMVVGLVYTAINSGTVQNGISNAISAIFSPG